MMVPLPKSTMVSSMTTNLGGFDAGRRTNKGVLFGAASSFMLPRFQFESSLDYYYMGRSLEAICELNESVFDPIVHLPSNQESDDDDDSTIWSTESSETRWRSSAGTVINASPTGTSTSPWRISSGLDECRKDETAKQSSMRLVAPRRMDSDDEIIVDEESDDICEDEEERVHIYDLLKLDKPASIPLRRMSLSRSLNSRSFHSFSSSTISSSCSLISFSEEDLEFGDDDYDEEERSPYEENEDTSKKTPDAHQSSDTPIRAPRRKLSPAFPPPAIYGAESFVA